MTITLKDIAKISGVSPATVSRVLSDDPRISEATREKVLARIQESGYRINDIARSLRTRRTNTIGFIAPRLAEEFFMTVAQGVEDQLRPHGYHMLIGSSKEDPAIERECIDLMSRRWVDGFILIPCSGDGAHLAKLARNRIPCVLVDRLVTGFPADTVVVDNALATRAALARLMERGITRIGFIGANETFSTARERYRGYLEAHRDHGIPIDPDIVKVGDFHLESGFALMRELDAMERPVEGVFIANHYMYLGAARYLLESGAAYRRELAIVNFDEMSATPVIRLARITISQPSHEIGAHAARMILGRLNGERTGPPETVTLATGLVMHDSRRSETGDNAGRKT